MGITHNESPFQRVRLADELDPQTRIAAGYLLRRCQLPFSRASACAAWLDGRAAVASLAARVWSDWGLGEQSSRKARVRPCAHEIERGGGACVRHGPRAAGDRGTRTSGSERSGGRRGRWKKGGFGAAAREENWRGLMAREGSIRPCYRCGKKNFERESYGVLEKNLFANFFYTDGW